MRAKFSNYICKDLFVTSTLSMGKVKVILRPRLVCEVYVMHILHRIYNVYSIYSFGMLTS